MRKLFVDKIYDILSDPANSNIVRWDDSGRSFVVEDEVAFAERILPNHFKHSNFESFVRQLHQYGFHKTQGSQHIREFAHGDFMRGRTDLISGIKRKVPASVKDLKHDIDELRSIVEDLQTKNEALVDDYESRIHNIESDYVSQINDLKQLNMTIMERYDELIKQSDSTSESASPYNHDDSSYAMVDDIPTTAASSSADFDLTWNMPSLDAAWGVSNADPFKDIPMLERRDSELFNIFDQPNLFEEEVKNIDVFGNNHDFMMGF